MLLNASGGLGAGLVQRYGDQLQKQLHLYLANQGKRYASQGEVFTLTPAPLPYRKLIHTTPCDGFYQTDQGVMMATLTKAFGYCNEDPLIKSIALVPLGCGYGSFRTEDFLTLISSISLSGGLPPSAVCTICLEDPISFAHASTTVEKLNLAICVN